MAQVRRLSLVLDLDSGKFSSKITDVTGKVAKFNHAVGQSGKALSNQRSQLGLYEATLGKATKAVWGLQSAFYAMTFVTGGFTAALVKTNSEAQRAIHMLQGMSKAVDELGRQKEAAQNFQWLINLSQRAPFSMDVLTNAFVKLKSVGLDPTKGSLMAIVDAVAAFGGTGEQMNRAILGVQQMMGKGVVSMEELRQQLGEAVPTAIQATADAFGISYGKMVKEISLGNVKSEPFIKKMTFALDQLYGGRAAKMMDTFSGQLSKAKTNFQQLLMVLGGLNRDGSFKKGGIMDTLTISLRELNKWLSNPETKEGMQRLGADIGSLLGHLANLVKWAVANASALKLLLGAFVAFKAVGMAGSAISAFSGVLTNLAPKVSTVVKVLNLATKAKAGNAAASVLLTRNLSSMGGVVGKLTKSTGGMRLALGLLLASVRILSPWGLLASAVLGVAAAFAKATAEAVKLRRAKKAVEDGTATTEEGDLLEKRIKTERERADAAEREAVRLETGRHPDRIGAAHQRRMARIHQRSAEALQPTFDQYVLGNSDRYREQGAHTGTDFNEQRLAYLNTLNPEQRVSHISATEDAFAQRAANASSEAVRQRIKGEHDAWRRLVIDQQAIWNEMADSSKINFEDTLLNPERGQGSKSGSGKSGAARLLDMVERLEARRSGMEAFVDTLDEGERAAAEMRQRIEDGEFDTVSETLKNRAIEAARQNALAMKDLRRVGEIFKSVRDMAEDSGEEVVAALEDMTVEASDTEASMGQFERGLKRLRAEALRLDPALAEDTERLQELDEQIAHIVDNERIKRLAEGIRDLAGEARRIEETKGLGRYGGVWSEYLEREREAEAHVRQVEKTADPAKRDQMLALYANKHSVVTGDILDKMLDALEEETEATLDAVSTQEEARGRQHSREVARIMAITNISKLSVKDQEKYGAKFLIARENLLKAADEKLKRENESPAQRMLREYRDVSKRIKDIQAEAVDEFMVALKDGNLKFDEFAKEIVEKILWVKAQAKVAEWIDGIISSFSAGFSGMMGGAASAPNPTVTASASHTGGIVGSEASFSKRVATSLFAGATRYHTGGIVGLSPGEVPAILQRGEGVFTREQMKALGPGGSVAIEFNLINESGQELQASEGGQHFDGERYIVDVIVSNMSTPGPLRTAVKNVR